MTSLSCLSDWCKLEPTPRSVINYSKPYLFSAASYDFGFGSDTGDYDSVCLCPHRPTEWFGGPPVIQIDSTKFKSSITLKLGFNYDGRNPDVHKHSLNKLNFSKFSATAVPLPRKFHPIDGAHSELSKWFWLGATINSTVGIKTKDDTLILNKLLPSEHSSLFVPTKELCKTKGCEPVPTTYSAMNLQYGVCMWQCVHFQPQKPSQFSSNRTQNAPVWLEHIGDLSDSLNCSATSNQRDENYIPINTAWLPLMYGLTNYTNQFVDWRDASLNLLQKIDSDPIPSISCGGVFASQCRPIMTNPLTVADYISESNNNISSFMTRTFNSTNNTQVFENITKSLQISLTNAIHQVINERIQTETAVFLFPKIGLHCYECNPNQLVTTNVTVQHQLLIQTNLYQQFTNELLEYEKYPMTDEYCANYSFDRYGIVGTVVFHNGTHGGAGLIIYNTWEWVDSALQISRYDTSCNKNVACTSRVYPDQCAKVPSSVQCEQVPLCEPCTAEKPLTTTTTFSQIPNLTFSPTHAAKQIAPEKELTLAVSIVAGIAVLILAALVVVTIRLYRNPGYASYADEEEKIPLIIP